MAEGKKSFVLYADQAPLFEGLPDDIAGKLIKLIFDYVNDKNPEPTDLLLQVAFQPIKTRLKADLKKWEKIKKARSVAGSSGNKKRWESGNNDDCGSQTIANDRKRSQTIANDRKPSQTIAKIADTCNMLHVINKKKKKKILKEKEKELEISENDLIYNIENWENDKKNFFNDFRWKEKFCAEKQIQLPDLESMMKDFITDLELKEDYKDIKELRGHFLNLFNKNQKNGNQQSAGAAKRGTSGDRIDVAKEW